MIRWDRLSRYGLLAMLAVLLLLYVNPLRHYVSTLHEAHRRAAEVGHPRADQPRAARRQARAVEQVGPGHEARALGMVLRGCAPTS